jgi:hypothetical protein
MFLVATPSIPGINMHGGIFFVNARMDKDKEIHPFVFK